MFKVLNHSKNLSSKETFLKRKKSEEMFSFSFLFFGTLPGFIQFSEDHNLENRNV